MAEGVFDPVSFENEWSEIRDHMHQTGGNFVKKLAELISAADPDNLQKIILAFPEILQVYDIHVSQKKAQSRAMTGRERRCLDSRACRDA